jgi:hypothetical protein
VKWTRFIYDGSAILLVAIFQASIGSFSENVVSHIDYPPNFLLKPSALTLATIA